MAGFITAEGLVIPAGADTYDYVNDQRRLAASARTIVPVANDTAAASVVSAMAADGRPVSDTNPLITWQSDTDTLNVRGSGSTPLPIPSINFNTSGSITGPSKPANKPWQFFFGPITTSTGGGGDTRTASFATISTGYGGFWFGYQGLPTFSGISYVNVMEGGNSDVYLGVYSIQDVNLTRIKWKGWRLDGTGPTNGYASITLNVMVIGW